MKDSGVIPTMERLSGIGIHQPVPDGVVERAGNLVNSRPLQQLCTVCLRSLDADVKTASDRIGE